MRQAALTPDHYMTGAEKLIGENDMCEQQLAWTCRRKLKSHGADDKTHYSIKCEAS
jgi:hypothetical protein